MRMVRRQSGVIVLNVPWTALDGTVACEFLNRAGTLALTGARLVLDFSRLETIDPAGIRALLLLLKQVNGSGGGLRLCNLNRRVQGFLVMVRLHHVFQIHRTKADAIRSFRRQDQN
jgi:anti-anti-sigma factor